MQLLVIPVTARFLREPNRARETELPLALERHIPVLPLLQEPGLEEPFSALCGDMQLLAREDVADREKALAGRVRSYQDKLRDFLESTLVDNDLAEKIRRAGAIGKPVLPVRMEDTDEGRLREMFRDLPDHEDAFLGQAGKLYLEFYRTTQNHIFFDALGQCVERQAELAARGQDRERARGLLYELENIREAQADGDFRNDGAVPAAAGRIGERLKGRSGSE